MMLRRSLALPAAMLTATAILLLAAQSYQTYGDSSTIRPQYTMLEATEPMEVMILFTKAKDNPNLRSKFTECLLSMLRHATGPLKLSIVGDEDSRIIARALFDKVGPRTEVTMTGIAMEPLAREVTRLLLPLLTFFRHSPNSYYGDNLFFLSIIAHYLFPDKHRLILLDSDLSFRKDVRQLWDQFAEFGPSEVIGIAREMQPVYRHVFHAYRNNHPGTIVGDPPPDGITGFNSGVLLLDLVKMRASSEYNSLVDVVKVEDLVGRYGFKGHLGDQDFYTLLSVEHPSLFHLLPCAWNRQLCRWWADHGQAKDFEKYYDCPMDIAIYHGNCNTPIPKE